MNPIIDVNTDFHNYVLGLIWSDGNYTLRDNKPRIHLGMCDYKLIEKLRMIITPHHKLYTVLPKKKTHNTFYSIVIQDKQIINSYLNHGLVSAKSNILTWPVNLSEAFIYSFIRGYFDGDGSVYLHHRENKYQYVGVKFTSGSQVFLESLKTTLNNNNIKTGNLFFDKRSNSCYLQISNKKAIINFYNFIYKNNGLHLTRKKGVFNVAGYQYET